MKLDPEILNKIVDAEEFLNYKDVKYRKDCNGVIIVEGDLDIRGLKLKQLPDLTNVVVNGGFNCGFNQLTSLKGAPQKTGYFFCVKNQFRSLEYIPKCFKKLCSDFGTYSNYDEIPSDLLTDKASIEQEFQLEIERTTKQIHRLKASNFPRLKKSQSITRRVQNIIKSNIPHLKFSRKNLKP